MARATEGGFRVSVKGIKALSHLAAGVLALETIGLALKTFGVALETVCRKGHKPNVFRARPIVGRDKTEARQMTQRLSPAFFCDLASFRLALSGGASWP